MPPPRRAAIAALTTVLMASPCAAQPAAAPKLSRSERAALQAIVRAADSGTAVQDVAERDWPVHVLRASDGAHYVAFSAPAPGSRPDTPVVAYVRLATREDPAAAATPIERSAVTEWLAGQAPLPALNRRGVAFGDMPTYGAGAIATRGPGSQSLSLLVREGERARERQEAEARERKAALEGEAAPRGPRPLLPFEDFDVRAAPSTATRGTVLRRSLTAGPGDYTLVVGWADPAAKDVASAVRLVRRRLTLGAASTTEFALSSVIVADEVTLRETPVPADAQTSRPYSIGALEITPAVDHVLRSDERLTLAVQVINARGSPAGKPDVVVGFRVLRTSGPKEEVIGTLASQSYNATTLPADFDSERHHPIFAAVTLPLKSFRRGDYRIEIAANDRVAGIGTTAAAAFSVTATAAALLADAPPLAPSFRRSDVLDAPVIEILLGSLSPERPSAAFAAALAAARAGRFAELIRDDDVLPDETAARAVLRVLGLFAIGDTAPSLVTMLQQARERGAAAGPVDVLIGAARAADGRDREAVEAWERGRQGLPAPDAAVRLIADALLRQGAAAEAAAVLERAAAPTDPMVLRRLAAARVQQGRFAEALRLLDPLLTRRPDDVDAQWLSLHALFAGFVSGAGPGADAAGRQRIAILATQYAAAAGPHAALAREWAEAAR